MDILRRGSHLETLNNHSFQNEPSYVAHRLRPALAGGFISKQHSSELSKTESKARPVLIHFRGDAATWLEDEKGDVRLTNSCQSQILHNTRLLIREY
jgi:hypothetical protein